jgi:hypothetical protein
MLASTTPTTTLRKRQLIATPPLEYRKVWSDRATGCKHNDITFFQPIPPPPAGGDGGQARYRFYRVADLAQCPHLDQPRLPVRCLVLADSEEESTDSELGPPLLKPPLDFRQIWNDRNTGASFGDCSIWEPIPPPDYVCLGHIITPSYTKPDVNDIRCVHRNCCIGAGAIYESDKRCLWTDRGSGAKFGDVSIWSLAPMAPEKAICVDGFLALPHYGKPNPAEPFRFCGLYCLDADSVTILQPSTPTNATRSPTTSTSSAELLRSRTPTSNVSGAGSGVTASSSPIMQQGSPSVSRTPTRNAIFGVDPVTLKLEPDEENGYCVPSALLFLKRAIYALEGHKEEGLFRLSGSESEMNLLKQHLNSGELDGECVTCVHSLATILKRWFSELPKHIFDATDVPFEDMQKDISVLPSHIHQPYRDCFLWLVDILLDVANNEATTKMNLQNLAVVVGPVLAPVPTDQNPLTLLVAANQATVLLKKYLDFRRNC